jgi:ATP-dependent exoDNAse (exonuclease V) alpha subunit
VKSAGVKFGNDQIFDMTHFDEVGRRIRWSKNEFSHRLALEPTASAPLAELDEVSLAYAITIHKSQGSEFPAIVTPLAMQQYMLLQRNLVYTGITRDKKLVVLVGQRKALRMAVKNNRTENRFSGLLYRFQMP